MFLCSQDMRDFFGNPPHFSCRDSRVELMELRCCFQIIGKNHRDFSRFNQRYLLENLL